MFVYPHPDPIALKVGPLQVRWYGLMYLVGFLAGWWLARRRAAQPGSTWSAVDVDDLIFEAPTKSSQAWFVKHFGPNVNLGNIPPDEVIPLETLRLGLRGDTLKEILLPMVEPSA